MKKVLAIAVGLAVLAFGSWAVAGPSCCSKAKSTSASASAACEKVEKTSAAASESKGTKASASGSEIKGEGVACVEKAVKLSIAGMQCGDCSKKVQAALSNLEGICASKVSYTRKNAEVVYNAAQLSEESIVQAVTTAGFTVASTKVSNWKVSKNDDCCKAKKSSKSSESDT
ncbi:MAG: cation transporter [candidate division Zixibacteria bacterium]|nr:cation transporter [candidate division Zixibacteria bacterium]MCI0596582.1 cation transporter [candidate division Zixibacteria bacterium]